MLDFFNTVVEYIQFFFNFISTTISSLVYGLTYLISGQGTVLVIIGYLPAIVGGACAAFLAIYLLRFLLLK